jgi:nucleoside triphosphatase
MQHPEVAVGGLVLNARGEVLLIRSPKWLDRFVMPGGHIELGEPAEKALRREILEETGLEVGVLRLLNVQNAINSPEFYKPRHFVFLNYLCRARNDGVRLDGKEAREYVWLRPEEAAEREDVEPFTKNVIRTYLALERK